MKRKRKEDLTKIIPIDTGGGEFPVVPHKVIPQHPFRMLLVAPQGGGKTNFICNLILRQYKGYFNRIIVCSPTIDNDEKWDVVRNTKGLLVENKKLEDILTNGAQKSHQNKKWKLVFANPAAHQAHKDGDKFDGKIYDEDMVKDMEEILPVFKEQQGVIDYLRDEGICGGDDEVEKEKPRFLIDRILIILDDQAGLFKHTVSKNPIVNIFLRHRHFSTSIIVATQAYKAIPKTIRINFSALILFEIPNQLELEDIYHEYPDKLDQDSWIDLYWKIVEDEPFSFFYFNNHFPAGHRIHKRFDSVYVIGKRSENDRVKEISNGEDNKDA